MTNTYCCIYGVETPSDGQQNCLKHVEYFIKINLRNCASRWLYYKKDTTEFQPWSFKRLQHEADHSAPYSVKIKESMEPCIHFPICFHSMQRAALTSPFTAETLKTTKTEKHDPHVHPRAVVSNLHVLYILPQGHLPNMIP